MKAHGNAEVVKVNLDRRAFTKHGQHMNARGKELMAKRIIEAIKHTLQMCKKTLIVMKWKEDANKDKQDPRETTIGIREGRDPTENQKDSGQAEMSENRQQETETVETTTKRNRKIPVTRREDFLWTDTSKRQAR